jgi:hypothetical protein
MQIPYHPLPLRPYQNDIKDGFHNPEVDEMLLVIGRRGGKTTTVFSEIIVPELVKKVQTIVAVYPTAKMGFKNFWNNIENDGFKTLEHIPKGLIKRQSNDEDDMRIELMNGSIFMCVGAGNTEALRGANGRLYWFDEFADMPIEAVNVVAPITDANGGKRIYSGTPKIDGINGETMRRMHVSFKKDITKYTCYIKATEYMSEAALEKVLKGYILRNGNDFKYKQEMLLDWGQSSSASYYGEIMSKKDKNGTIGEWGYNKNYPVYTAWDLGKADSMVVLFFQFFKGRPRIIDIIEKEGSNIKAMAKELKAKPYVYAWHFLPHDGTVSSLNDGVSRLKTLSDEGYSNASTLRRAGVGVGIGYVEDWLPKILINVATTITKHGSFHRRLRKYKKKFNPETGNYAGADHKTQSHIADALRYMCTALTLFFDEKGEFMLALDNDRTEYESDLATVSFVNV